MAQEWNIKSRSDTCAKSGDIFEDGTTVVSRLVFNEDGYHREDFSEAEWEEGHKEEAVSVWRSVYHPPTPPPEEAVKKETAESLLRQLMETEEEANRNVIYILSVMLERRRILVERDVHARDDGTKMRVYEHRKSGETFLVVDPELKLSELAGVQQEVLDRLGGSHEQRKEAPDGPD